MTLKVCLVKKPKSLSDEPVEPHTDDIPVSELSKLDSIEYCGRDSDNAPGMILRKGSLEVWTLIAAWLRPIELGIKLSNFETIVVCSPNI